MIDPKAFDVGVLVGRFQVPKLHGGHRALIEQVIDNHKKVIVFLGVSPVITINNPLDFESRRQMIQANYPNIVVLPIADTPNDSVWSTVLDSQITMVTSPTQSVVLYGSRDSFIEYYDGRHPTFELLQEDYKSGTEVRKEVKREAIPNPDFRAGVIWAAANRFPTVYTTVDIAIFDPSYNKILLGRKPYSEKWCLIGGFADPESPTFEDDVYREVREETGVGLLYKPKYVCSALVDDWRYRNEVDVIKTILFTGVTQDAGRAGDDIEEVQWFDANNIPWKKIQECHVDLLKSALEAKNVA